eukprot:TRINITY_DN5742_c3_g2_i1.p1 TRINITY_DN5742_c3_g2~~TRINITY_DN5742_c3_g2_i1.p1  ORF type:complete len:1317 (+),score=155.07 TRINITY_DN5742_c3_g2_i1:154-3951(+)
MQPIGSVRQSQSAGRSLHSISSAGSSLHSLKHVSVDVSDVPGSSNPSGSVSKTESRNNSHHTIPFPTRRVRGLSGHGGTSPKMGARADTISPDGSQKAVTQHSRVHTVKIEHTGGKKEIPCEAGLARIKSSGKELSATHVVSSVRYYRDQGHDDLNTEPTPILSPPPGSSKINEGGGLATVHHPKTHSIQSLFKRAPVSKVVKHVPARHRHRKRIPDESQETNSNSGHSQNLNVSHTPERASSRPSESSSTNKVFVEKVVSFSDPHPQSKLGITWRGIEFGCIVAGLVKPGSTGDNFGFQDGMRLVAIDKRPIINKTDLEETIGPQGSAMERLWAGERIRFLLEVDRHQISPLDRIIDDVQLYREDDSELASDSDSTGSYEMEYTVMLPAYHPIFEAVWLPVMTSVVPEACFIQIPHMIEKIGLIWTLILVLGTAGISTVSLASISAILTKKIANCDSDSPYHMISRHVGTEYGGAVGFLYWVVMVMLLASRSHSLGEVYFHYFFDSSSSLTFLGIWLSAWAIQLLAYIFEWAGIRYVSVCELFAVLCTAIYLLVFVFALVPITHEQQNDWRNGWPTSSSVTANLWTTPTGEYDDLVQCFCRFFPSCLGILVVLGRATDLKEPEKDLPKATLFAMIACWIVLVLVTLFIGVFYNPFKGTETVTITVAQDVPEKVSSLKFAGIVNSFEPVYIFCVGISVLIQCWQAMQIAPNVLSAISMDHIARVLESFTPGPDEKPTRAALFSFLIAALLVPLRSYLYAGVTIMSLICLLIINGVAAFGCFMHTTQNNTHSYGYSSWKISTLAFISCVYTIFSINWYIALTLLLLTMAVGKYLEFKSDYTSWGEGVKGVQLQHALEKLLSLECVNNSTKNWRPQLMVLVQLDSDGAVQQPRLLSIADQLKMGKGLVIFAAVVEGSFSQKKKVIEHAENSLTEQKIELGIQAFTKVIAADTYLEGCSYLFQGLGLGCLCPNTVLLVWPEDWKTRRGSAAEFSTLLTTAHDMSKAVLVIRGIKSFPCARDELKDVVDAPLCGDHIDLWWIVHDGGIELLIAFLLRQHAQWMKCKLRIFTIVPSGDDTDGLAMSLSEELSRLRIDALLIVHPVEGEWIREFLNTAEDESHQNTKLMEKLCVSDDERSHVIDQVLQSHTCSSRPSNSPVTEERTNFSQIPRVASGVAFADFPMVDLVGARAEEEYTAQNRMSVSYHFECLNELIAEHSQFNDLVVISFPDCTNFFTAEEFMECMEKMLHGIQRAILIRGTGEQVITEYW